MLFGPAQPSPAPNSFCELNSAFQPVPPQPSSQSQPSKQPAPAPAPASAAASLSQLQRAPASLSASQPASQPASQSASQPASRLASPLVSQPAPARHLGKAGNSLAKAPCQGRKLPWQGCLLTTLASLAKAALCGSLLIRAALARFVKGYRREPCQGTLPRLVANLAKAGCEAGLACVLASAWVGAPSLRGFCLELAGSGLVLQYFLDMGLRA